MCYVTEGTDWGLVISVTQWFTLLPLDSAKECYCVYHGAADTTYICRDSGLSIGALEILDGTKCWTPVLRYKQPIRSWNTLTTTAVTITVIIIIVIKTKLHGLSPRANYTDRANAACRRSDCQLLRIEGATWSAWRIPTAVFSVS
jgi:hypothetical protein